MCVFDCAWWKSSHKSIAVVQSRSDKGLDKKLCSMLNGVIVEELSWMVKSCCRVGVAGRTRSSVFARLSCRWCSFIHAEVSARHPEIRATRCWKQSSEILVHIDFIASRSCCRFVGCTSWCESLVPPHPKGALLDWDLVTVEVIWVKWTHCHVQETSLRWFELCDMVHYPAGSTSEDEYTVVIKGWTWSATILR